MEEIYKRSKESIEAEQCIREIFEFEKKWNNDSTKIVKEANYCRKIFK